MTTNEASIAPLSVDPIEVVNRYRAMLAEANHERILNECAADSLRVQLNRLQVDAESTIQSLMEENRLLTAQIESMTDLNSGEVGSFEHDGPCSEVEHPVGFEPNAE